jgi:peptidoglycan/xylan/chitin deacetylase (PgdA/CDA1 family)
MSNTFNDDVILWDLKMAKFILNIHGVGDNVREFEPGERPYWLEREELAKVLDFVQMLSFSLPIALTVDDGNSSDYEIVAPELRKRGLLATFFVLAGKLDQAGYLRRSQVRDLSAEGFKIGSHGLHHVRWTTCDPTSLALELDKSKEILEDVTGRTISAAAAPFGSYDWGVLRALARSGYQQVFSSDGAPRLTSAWPTPRLTLRTGIDIASLGRRLDSQALHDRFRSELRILAKSWLPRRAAQSVRAAP